MDYRIFIGFDHRQPISFNVLQQSIFTRASKPVSIHALVLNQLPLKRTGLTPFTFTRFLVPYLCDFKGWALFLDIDMLCLGDICSLMDMRDDKYAVMVSKNRLKFEWASLMLFNCEKCKILTPEYIEKADMLHQISFAKEEEIGDLPREWNHLVGYDIKKEDRKLIHYTQGIPIFPETEDSDFGDEWRHEFQTMNSSFPWKELMGNSVHAVDGKPRYKSERPL